MAAKRNRRKYSPEFKAEAVALVLESGLTQAQASRDLGISESVLGRWVHDARAVAAGGPTPAERDELRRLRRELEIVKKERDILRKAAAFFAKEIL